MPCSRLCKKQVNLKSPFSAPQDIFKPVDKFSILLQFNKYRAPVCRHTHNASLYSIIKTQPVYIGKILPRLSCIKQIFLRQFITFHDTVIGGYHINLIKSFPDSKQHTSSYQKQPRKHLYTPFLIPKNTALKSVFRSSDEFIGFVKNHFSFAGTQLYVNIHFAAAVPYLHLMACRPAHKGASAPRRADFTCKHAVNVLS